MNMMNMAKLKGKLLVVIALLLAPITCKQALAECGYYPESNDLNKGCETYTFGSREIDFLPSQSSHCEQYWNNTQGCIDTIESGTMTTYYYPHSPFCEGEHTTETEDVDILSTDISEDCPPEGTTYPTPAPTPVLTVTAYPTATAPGRGDPYP